LNEALDLPAGIVTLAWTVAAAVFELERVTVNPPAGAVPDNVTVPVTPVEELPLTVIGDTLSATRTAG